MAARPMPSQSEVERAFQEEMARHGFLPGSIQPDEFKRFDAPGDKPGKGNGWYKLKLGEYPVGWFGDWKLGEPHQWFYRDANAGELTDKERKTIQAEQRRLKAEAAQARELRQAEVAEDASAMWKRADSNVEGHPYLERKHITAPRGLKIHTAKDGTRLLTVPMWSFDMNGQPQLTSLQLIDGEGRKTFLKAGKVEGCFFSIKGDGSALVICEGVATAFSIWQATGLGVFAAFNAGNLIEVAKEVQRHRHGTPLLIAGDDDAIEPDDWAQRGNGRPWVNQGRKKAEAAAKVVGCRFTVPYFNDGPHRTRTDYNDLFIREGETAVRNQITSAFTAKAPEMADQGAEVVDISEARSDGWRQFIFSNASGKIDSANVANVGLYIANHPMLRGRLRYNLFTKEMEIDGIPAEDHDVATFRHIMHNDRKMPFKSKKTDVLDEMEAEARRNQYDPLVEYLSGLQWDGKTRVDTWLPDYLGTDDTRYTRAIGRKSLIGAVARALSPGVKNDTMVVLEGEQGVGKSTALRYLFGDRFFVDHLPDFSSKDSFQQLQGAWCVEVAELSALTKADVKDVKQFLSRLVDKFRPPFGRLPIQVPRRTVLWGTVNPEEGQGYLKDTTGGRRFWPVETNEISLSSILLDRDQLWAEAVQAFRAGERWHLEEAEDIALAKEQQSLRREVHPWEEPIGQWLMGKWECTVPEVLIDALKITPDKQNTQSSRMVGACLRALGWRSVTKRVGDKVHKVFSSPAQRGIGPQDDMDF